MEISHKVCLTLLSMTHVHGPSHLRTVGYVTHECTHDAYHMLGFYAWNPPLPIGEEVVWCITDDDGPE